MATYLSLLFKSEFNNSPILKTWLVKRGDRIRKGQELFLYGEGPQQKSYASLVGGTFKVSLAGEGQTLPANCEVGILEVKDEEAKYCQKKGVGKILEPEEIKKRADAASIRLPPD